MTSTAGARPLPSMRGIRRCETTAFSTLASCSRTCFCWCGGNTAMMRLIVSVASSVCRVEKHEVAGLGREQAGLDGLEVAHLADEDDVGILPQRAAQRLGEGARVDRHLALVDDRLLVAVQELDRILDRHHVRAAVWLMWSISAASVVLLPLPVVPVTSTSPRSSSAIVFSTCGRPELVDRPDLHRDDAEHQADGAALLEDVAAEAAEAGRRCRRGRPPAPP